MYHESNKRGAKRINCNNLPGLSNLQQASAGSFPQSNQIKQKPTTAFEAKNPHKKHKHKFVNILQVLENKWEYKEFLMCCLNMQEHWFMQKEKVVCH